VGSDTYVVERRQRVDAPPAAVFDRLVDFHRWRTWSPWEDIDPSLQRTYRGPDAGVGATYEWEGNRKAGKGRMTITDVDTNAGVTIDLEFLKPFKSRTTSEFRLERVGDATDVTWTMTGPKTFMTRVMGIFTSMDKMIGPDFEKGLGRLKAEAEAQAAP
jgi:hypothetical protein